MAVEIEVNKLSDVKDVGGTEAKQGRVSDVVTLAPVNTHQVRRAQCTRKMCDENSFGTVWEQFGNSLGECKTRNKFMHSNEVQMRKR